VALFFLRCIPNLIIQAGDLGVELDTGNNQPGALLQRHENGRWQDYMVDGQPVTSPVDIEQLPPGRYRLVEK